MYDELARITKAYDLRGIADETFTEHHARALGRGFAAWTSATNRLSGAGAIVVGRDCRTSSPRLAAAVIDGIRAEGVDVIDIALCSTDMAYAASGVFGAPVVMITASHNPGEYNGAKLAGPCAEPLSRETGLADIITVAAQRAAAPVAPTMGSIRSIQFLGRFVELITAQIDSTPLRGLDIVADVANGMGALVVPAVAEAIGMRARILHGNLDGSFPNHPADPLNPANLVDLQAALTARSAFAGVAFDGDADRALLVDDAAVAVSGSTTTAMVATGMLARDPGATILYNLICSRAVPEIIAEHGGRSVRTPVGHSIIKRYMASTGAIFGGEHSAHHYFRSFWRADSGILAALHALALAVESTQPLSITRQRFERYVATGEVNYRVADPRVVLDEAARRFDWNLVDRLDGVSLSFDTWWGNLRGSNTEPLLRVNIEGVDADELETGVACIAEFLEPYLLGG